jgi:Fe2+ or Zn2+ uptake regulation protein
MMEGRSLEEDILSLFWETEDPLSIRDIHICLKEKEIMVPVEVIQKILTLFEKAKVIKSKSGIGWSKQYQALISKLEMNLATSESLLISCLQASNIKVKKHIVLNIIERITHLEYFKDEDQ